MKKLIVALSVGALMMGTTAMADSENKALVFAWDDICGIVVDNTYWGGGDLHLVATKSGNTIYKCQNIPVPEGSEPAKAIHDKVPCEMFSRGSDGIIMLEGVAKTLITPAGSANYSCSVKGNVKED